MKQITLDIPDELAATLDELAKLCSEADESRQGGTTHGALTVPELLVLLAEDAGMVLTRSGSWEGANMTTVFEAHGYQF